MIWIGTEQERDATFTYFPLGAKLEESKSERSANRELKTGIK